MSINLSVYVGPYLKCSPRREHDDGQLRDLIGEGDRQGDWNLLGPNVPTPNIARDLYFSKGFTNEGSPIGSIVREMALFETQFAHEIREIRGDYQSVEVCWGIVPGWF